MTTLSDREIFKCIKEKTIKVHPLLNKKQIQGARIDLRLDNIFYIIRRFEKPCYDLMDYSNNERPKTYGYIRTIPYGHEFILHPGDYVLAPLFEFVELPNNIIGRLDGRSSLGRLGVLVHSTAGSIDPGYKGSITIELMNGGMFPVALYPLMRVATLSFMYLTNKAKYPYEGKYGVINDFPGAESQLYKDWDKKYILDMRTNS